MSDLERAFETIWKQLGGRELTSEYRFDFTRKWRFDFAIPDNRIAFEIEGGIWTKGRHTRAKGFTDDCEKYNEAANQGWRVFRFTSIMLDDPIRYIEPVVRAVGENLCDYCGRDIPFGEDICNACIPF